MCIFSVNKPTCYNNSLFGEYSCKITNCYKVLYLMMCFYPFVVLKMPYATQKLLKKAV